MVTTTLDLSVLSYRNRVVIRYATDSAEMYKGPILLDHILDYNVPEIVRGAAYGYLLAHDVGFEVDVQPVERQGGPSSA